MREFKELFEKLGYTFQSADVLEDVYLFYRYYNNKANKGISAILLEGDPGCGKTFLSEVFSKFLEQFKEVEYIYTQCVEETNSDRLIATYNVPAIVKGDADKSVAEGILTKAINLANEGKNVILTIDELDKAREALDSYFLNFLQNGKIETSNNEILSLTEDGRKNLYTIFIKNNERNLLDALLRRCSVIKLPPMPPVLAYKTLIKTFENVEHDPKFLKFISKVYEAIYNEQMDNNEELLSRLPALQELITAITSDYELYENSISSTRRINNLIRKLGKDNESREIITDILIKKFKYQNQESNYTMETLDLDMDDPEDYMSSKDADSLVEQYIKKKDNGEYIFEEDEFEDPMKDIANILDNMKDDSTLVFLDKENKEKIIEFGVITHYNPKDLEMLFDEIKLKGNPNSRFGFLSFEGDNFIGLMKYKNTLILVANKEYVSPRLLMNGLCMIVTTIYSMYPSKFKAEDFKLTGLNAKVLSNLPSSVLNKMEFQNGVYTYLTSNMKVTYDESLNISYFKYMQKFKAEPFYETIEKICKFNPELAIPGSSIYTKTFYKNRDKNLMKSLSYFEREKERWDGLKSEGWKVEIGEFIPIELPISDEETDYFVFEWKTKMDRENKRLYVYPKYQLKGNYLLYTSNDDFENDEFIKTLDPFQKEIAFFARNIFGNFIPQSLDDGSSDYFSYSTMYHTDSIERSNNKNLALGINRDITLESDFTDYYNSISQPSVIITSSKVLKRTLR